MVLLQATVATADLATATVHLNKVPQSATVATITTMDMAAAKATARATVATDKATMTTAPNREMVATVTAMATRKAMASTLAMVVKIMAVALTPLATHPVVPTVLNSLMALAMAKADKVDSVLEDDVYQAESEDLMESAV